MQLGDQVVTFVEISEGPPDVNGIPEEIGIETPVSGCLFRPLRSDEKSGFFEIATEVWKATCPPVAAALTASANGELKHDGITYQNVAGAQPYRGLDGVVDHVVLMCRRQVA
jgi:hypothetical protein